SRPADVIHHFVRPPLDDRPSNAGSDVIERLVPGHTMPSILSAPPGAPQRVQNAIGIIGLIERRRSFRAVSPARAGMLGIAFVFADLQRLAIDVCEKAAGRLAVEACRRHEHVVPLDATRPRARVELGPIVPSLARWKRDEVRSARTGILLHASGTSCAAPTCACS